MLLIAAGALKVIAPAPASDALGVAGLPSHPTIVRVGAAVGVFDLSFAAFAAFVELLRRKPDAQSCGCFGGTGEVPSGRHVLGNLVLALGCAVAAATGAPSMVVLVQRHVGLGLVFVVASAAAAWLAALLLSGGPKAAVS